MKKLWLAVLLCTCGSPVHAQLDSNSITISASRTLTVQPDQIILGVVIDSAPSAGLDDILRALQGLGITVANLSSVDSATAYLGTGAPPDSNTVKWVFSLPVPLNQASAKLAFLNTLQQSIAQKNAGLKLTLGAQGIQVSPELLASQQCSTTDLVADARAQASKLANAAGLTAGPIVALSDGTSPQGDPGYYSALRVAYFSPSQWFDTGSFSFNTAIFSFTSSPPITNLYCSVVVKFQLLRYQ